MGLINWFKDKRFSDLSFSVKQLYQEVQLLEQRLEMLTNRVNSIASQRAKSKKVEMPEFSKEELEFIAGLPPHERERFKNLDDFER